MDAKQVLSKFAKQPAGQMPRHDCHGVHPDQTHEEWKASLEKDAFLKYARPPATPRPVTVQPVSMTPTEQARLGLTSGGTGKSAPQPEPFLHPLHKNTGDPAVGKNHPKLPERQMGQYPGGFFPNIGTFMRRYITPTSYWNNEASLSDTESPNTEGSIRAHLRGLSPGAQKTIAAQKALSTQRTQAAAAQRARDEAPPSPYQPTPTPVHTKAIDTPRAPRLRPLPTVTELPKPDLSLGRNTGAPMQKSFVDKYAKQGAIGHHEGGAHQAHPEGGGGLGDLLARAGVSGVSGGILGLIPGALVGGSVGGARSPEGYLPQSIIRGGITGSLAGGGALGGGLAGATLGGSLGRSVGGGMGELLGILGGGLSGAWGGGSLGHKLGKKITGPEVPGMARQKHIEERALEAARELSKGEKDREKESVDLSPFARGFFTNCADAGYDESQVKQAVDKIGDQYGKAAGDELRSGLEEMEKVGIWPWLARASYGAGRHVGKLKNLIGGSRAAQGLRGHAATLGGTSGGKAVKQFFSGTPSHTRRAVDPSSMATAFDIPKRMAHTGLGRAFGYGGADVARTLGHAGLGYGTGYYGSGAVGFEDPMYRHGFGILGALGGRGVGRAGGMLSRRGWQGAPGGVTEPFRAARKGFMGSRLGKAWTGSSRLRSGTARRVDPTGFGGEFLPTRLREAVGPGALWQSTKGGVGGAIAGGAADWVSRMALGEQGPQIGMGNAAILGALSRNPALMRMLMQSGVGRMKAPAWLGRLGGGKTVGDFAQGTKDFFTLNPSAVGAGGKGMGNWWKPHRAFGALDPLKFQGTSLGGKLSGGLQRAGLIAGIPTVIGAAGAPGRAIKGLLPEFDPTARHGLPDEFVPKPEHMLDDGTLDPTSLPGLKEQYEKIRKPMLDAGPDGLSNEQLTEGLGKLNDIANKMNLDGGLSADMTAQLYGDKSNKGAHLLAVDFRAKGKSFLQRGVDWAAGPQIAAAENKFKHHFEGKAEAAKQQLHQQFEQAIKPYEGALRQAQQMMNSGGMGMGMMSGLKDMLGSLWSMFGPMGQKLSSLPLPLQIALALGGGSLLAGMMTGSKGLSTLGGVGLGIGALGAMGGIGGRQQGRGGPVPPTLLDATRQNLGAYTSPGLGGEAGGMTDVQRQQAAQAASMAHLGPEAQGGPEQRNEFELQQQRQQQMA